MPWHEAPEDRARMQALEDARHGMGMLPNTPVEPGIADIVAGMQAELQRLNNLTAELQARIAELEEATRPENMSRSIGRLTAQKRI